MYKGKKVQLNTRSKLLLLVSSLLLMLMVIACGGGSTPTPTPTPITLSVTPSTHSIQAGSTTPQTFTATFSDGSSADAVNWSITTNNGTIAPTVGASTVFTPSASATPGTVTLTATGGGKTATAVITFTDPPATVGSITSVEIETDAGETDSSSKQVRQGVGDISLIINGTELGGISLARLGDITGTIVTNGETAATITFTIPHGEEIGDKTLSLTTDVETLTRPAAVIVTKITVGGPTGSDTAGRGTTDSPYRSLANVFANVLAEPGDNIFIINGTYSATATGETFDYNVSGLTVEGESEAGVILDGAGAPASTSSLIARDTVTGFPTLLTKLTVRNFGDTGGFGALIIAGEGSVDISEVTSNNNEFGLSVGERPIVTVTESTFNNNEQNGLFTLGANNTAGVLTITDSNFSSNGSPGAGVFADGMALDQFGEVSLNRVTVDGNGRSGISIGDFGTGVSNFKMRNSSLTNNGRYGIHFLTNNDLLDMGKPSLTGSTPENGNNTLTGNALGAIVDSRPDGATSQIWASGNASLGGSGPLPTGLRTNTCLTAPPSYPNAACSGTTGTQASLFENASTGGVRWSIEGQGNTINFGP